MADSLLVKDVMLPAIYLEGNMTTSETLKLFKQKNVEYGVVGDESGKAFGMVPKKLLRAAPASKPVRYVITKELQAVPSGEDTPLNTIVQGYQENLRLNPDLAGFVLIDKGIVQGILLRDLVEKQALRVKVDQIGRDAQELYRNIDSLQERMVEYENLLQGASELPDESTVAERTELKRLLDEKQQLGVETNHLQRNTQELGFALKGWLNQQIPSLGIQRMSSSVQDLLEQLERLSRDERILNDELDRRISMMSASRLPGPPVSTDPNAPPEPIKVECPICHETDEVKDYNPRNPPRCSNKHQMNRVV